MFTNVDEQIRDLVIGKCKSHHLRTRLLEKGKDLTLNQVRTTAQTLKASISQAKIMETSIHNETLSFNVINDKAKDCFRCGESGHFSKDKSCPALGKKCHKCGIMGHFQ